MKFKRANAYIALFFFFFSRKRYITLAINHGMAINLEAPDLLGYYKAGRYPKVGWEEEATIFAKEAAAHIDKGIWRSFILIFLAALIACSVSFMKGNIHPSLPINSSLAFTFIGSFLAGWATLMELGGSFATCCGEALHELIHPAMFRLLFVPGVCLVSCQACNVV